MCLIIYQNIKHNPLWLESVGNNKFRALKDIKCYKLLDEELYSEFMRFQYKLGKLETIDESDLVIRGEDVSIGFHSWQEPHTNYISGLFPVKCIIPKDSLVFIGEQHDAELGFASSQIVITKVLSKLDIAIYDIKRFLGLNKPNIIFKETN